MNRITGLMNGPYSMYVRTLLEFRVDNLRKHMARRDVGASAIELAVITAIVGLVAVTLALLIKTVVGNNSKQIQKLSNP
jgi:Flp pilus assembly pilin Flp